MKKLVLISGALFLGFLVRAQKPVTWTYTAKKIADKTFEVHIKASIEEGWHVYASKQPNNFIGTPTIIEFTKHPLLVFSGVPAPKGNLIKKKEPTLGLEAWEFIKDVDFVQKVVMKNEIKTNITGTILFQACTDEMCLQPTTINFSVPVQ